MLAVTGLELERSFNVIKRSFVSVMVKLLINHVRAGRRFSGKTI